MDVSLAGPGFVSAATVASACNRLARVTMPTSLPSRTTSTRLIWWRSMRCTISSSGASSVTDRTSAVITSPTLRPLVCTYSLARRPGPMRNSIQRVRLRWVPVSVRRSRSPSVTMPTTEPPASTTGRPLNLRSSISWMASVIEASGEMETGSGVMTSAALMGNLLVRLNVSMPLAVGSADPCLTNGSMLRIILALVSPVIHAGSSAKGNSISQRSSSANRFLRLQSGGPPCLRFQSERFYFWLWHLLQLLPRPLGKATNAIARAKRGVSPDTRAKVAIPARIVSPTSTSVELLGSAETHRTPQLFACLRSLLAASFGHASRLSDQVCEYAEIGEHDQGDHPDRFDPAGYVMAPKQVANDYNEQPKPEDEYKYREDVGYEVAESEAFCEEEHCDSPCSLDRPVAGVASSLCIFCCL